MPTITLISPSKRRPHHQKVYLDGAFAFSCKTAVLARLQLSPGTTVDDQTLRLLGIAQDRQDCFDRATRYLGMRLHSRGELSRKLSRAEWGQSVIDDVLDQLTKLGYLNDENFAQARAVQASRRKQHAPRRIIAELNKSGISSEAARAAINSTLSAEDHLAAARRLAEKQVPRLRRLDPEVARRRLAGALARRGFEFEMVHAIIEETIGQRPDPET